MSHGYFVTGTDTNVGKTVVSALLTLKTQGVYWKPIQTGVSVDEADQKTVKHLTLLEDDHFYPTTVEYGAPLSPHEAARLEGERIDCARLIKPLTKKNLIIEGAGGVLCPINDKTLMIDLIDRFQIPAIVVARSCLGTINHTLLTLQALRERKCFIAGVVMNGEKNPSNKKAIEFYGKVPVLAEIEPMRELSASSLQELIKSGVLNDLCSVLSF